MADVQIVREADPETGGVWTTRAQAESGGGGVTPTLEAVLTAGADGGGLDIENVGAIEASDIDASDDIAVGGTFTAGGGNFSIDSGGGVSADTGDNAFSVSAGDGSVDLSADTVSIDANGTIGRVRIGSEVLIFKGPNVAPVDDELIAGWFGIWFDSTNGAAKLMIKAKQADGTVKTGSVNVQT